MIRKLIVAAVMAVLFTGSAFAQGFGGSEQERTGKMYRKNVFFGGHYLLSLDHTTGGLNLQVALGEKWRIDTGLEFLMAWGLPADFDWLVDRYGINWEEDEFGGGSAYGYGLFASLQFRHSISRDGFFNFYVGPMITLHTVAGNAGDYDLINQTPWTNNGLKQGEDFDGGVFGVGAVIGVEWDFSNRIQTADFGAFQVRYRTDYRIGLDLRPTINIVRPYDEYPALQITIGCSFGYMF